MTRKSRSNTALVFLPALVAVLLVASRPAGAQVTPFKVTGGGIADHIPLTEGDTSPHWAVGNATRLGKYHGEGVVRLDKFTSPTTATFSSAEPFVFTAANGDDLAFEYGRADSKAKQPGTVTLHFLPKLGPTVVFAVFVAEFNPVPADCTGRFTKVTNGSFMMTAVTEPFDLRDPVDVGYTWEGEGWIEFGQGK